jgi:hypothetical protein
MTSSLLSRAGCSSVFQEMGGGSLDTTPVNTRLLPGPLGTACSTVTFCRGQGGQVVVRWL